MVADVFAGLLQIWHSIGSKRKYKISSHTSLPSAGSSLEGIEGYGKGSVGVWLGCPVFVFRLGGPQAFGSA